MMTIDIYGFRVLVSSSFLLSVRLESFLVDLLSTRGEVYGNKHMKVD